MVPDELWWGAEWALRCLSEDGSVQTGAFGGWSAVPDSVPGLGVDRLTQADARATVFAMALARTALALRSTDPARAEKALKGALFFYEPLVRAWDDNGGDAVPPLHAIYDVPKLVLAETYLALATGDARYRDAARRHVRQNLAILREGAYFDPHYIAGADYTGGYRQSPLPLDFGWAPAEFALQFPDDPLVPEIKTAVRDFMHQAIIPVTARGPFGHAGEWNRDPLPWNGYRYSSSYYNAVAHVAALAAMLLDEPLYLEIAERQLQWSCGANVRGASFMSGLGHKQNGIGSYVFNYPECRVRPGQLHCLPGLVSKRWDFGTGIPPKVARGQASAPFGSFANGYLTGTVPGSVGGSEWTTHHTGNMILAAATVHRALAQLRGR